jgi:hypothetical protein
MDHIFVETNWVVDYAAPLPKPAAIKLLERAAAGSHRLYVPSFCLTEGRGHILREKLFKDFAKPCRDYLLHERSAGSISREEDEVVIRFLDRLKAYVNAQHDDLESRLDLLRHSPGVEVFAPDEEILNKAIDLSISPLHLKPFDQMVLAAVLVKARRLPTQDGSRIYFCEYDSDLQPWDSVREPKPMLKHHYDEAGIEVRGSYLIADFDQAE